MSTTEQQFDALLSDNKSLQLTLATLEPSVSAMVRNAMLIVYIAGKAQGIRDSEAIVRAMMEPSQ